MPSLARSRRSLFDRLAGPVLLGCALAAAGAALGVLYFLARETFVFLSDVPLSRFLGDLSWTPLAEQPQFGVWPLLAGTAQLAAGATAIAVLPGVLAAVFLRYHAGRGFARIAHAALTVLAGIPAVVYGYLALTFVTPLIRRFVWPAAEAFNGLSACLVLAVMILPTIVLLSERAIASVPRTMLDEAMAMGASRGRALIRLALPAASPGIAGSVVLALTRAAGETMVVTLAAGNPAGLTWNPLAGVRSATAYLAQASAGGLAPGTIEYGACFAVAAVLLLLTFGLHALGRALVAGSRRTRSRPQPTGSAPTRLPGASAAAAIAALAVGILSLLLIRGAGVLDPAFLLSPPSRLPELAGVASALAGTLWMAVVTAAMCVPIGVGAAVYLHEYATRNPVSRVVRGLLANLQGVPSVVYGMVGLAMFAHGLGLGANLLAGGLTLALLAMPAVVAATGRALDAVPHALRGSGFALGATRWQVLRDQVLPAAAPGIARGCRTALMRTAGAAAPLLMLGGATFMTFVPTSPGDPLVALPVEIFDWTARPPEAFVALAAGASVVLVCVVACVGLVVHAVLARVLQ